MNDRMKLRMSKELCALPRRSRYLLSSSPVGRLQICLSIGLLFMAVGCGESDSKSDKETSDVPAAAPAVPVHTATVVRQKLVPEFALVGTVTAIRRTVIGSPVEGRVLDVTIEAGDPVKARPKKEGSRDIQSAPPIVQLSTETIKLEIAAAEAELTRLKHELAELKSGSRPEEIARAKAELEAAKAVNEFAENRFKRATSLSESRVASTDELETAKSVALAAQQRLIAAQADLELAEAGPRTEQIDQAVARMEQQMQQIARLNVQLRHHSIYAPFDGFVVEKLAEAGQWLTRGAPVVEVVALDPIDVVVHVPEAVVHQLSIGDDVPLRVAALPKEHQALTGKIEGISPSADQRARTFPVRIRLDNPVYRGEFLLRDGMQARATLSGEPQQALMVPKDALVLGGQMPVLMLAEETPDGKHIAVRVEVETGVAQDSLISIIGDLQEGRKVVISGNERLQAGQLLAVTDKSDAPEPDAD